MQDTYQRGIEKRRELFGAETEKSMDYFKKLAPDLDRITVEELFGDLFCRAGLEPRIRSLCTVAILATLGKEPAVKNHIRGALKVGATKQEIIEVLHHVFFFAGMPAAAGALRAADEAFTQQGLS